jgi:hypothetical protein
MGIPDQLQALGLASFEGRQHSGIDVRDTTLNALVQSLTFDFINSHRMLITLQGESRNWPGVGSVCNPIALSILVADGIGWENEEKY